MFDDVSPDQQQNSFALGNQNQPLQSPTLTPPPSIPMTPVVGKEPEDIFSAVDYNKSANPGAMDMTTITDDRMSMPSIINQQSGDGSKVKKIILVVALILLAAGAAGFVYYKFVKLPVDENQALNEPVGKLPQADKIDNSKNNQPAKEVVEQPVVEPTTEQPVQPVENTPAVVVDVDTDADGLTDTQEAGLGTDPNSADTDLDGLTDLDEYATYKTDPKNNDSDGDTYKDGDEIKNGYNPLGAGKLDVVDLPATPATSTSTTSTTSTTTSTTTTTP